MKEVCELPANVGEGQDYIPHWYFDTKDGRCRQFYYGGSGGNGNNFNSEEECLARCEPQKQTPNTEQKPEPVETSRPLATEVQAPKKPRGNQDHCRFEADAGECRVAEARYYYSNEEGRCQQFTYGGCGGNENNFETQDECERSCWGSQDACSLPQLVGECNDNETRWYFDDVGKTCTQFNYGGCNGNANNFATNEECQSQCNPTDRPSPDAEPSVGLGDVSTNYYCYKLVSS